MIRYVTIPEDRRGLLIRDGKFKRLLEPGRYSRSLWWFGQREQIEIFPVKEAEMSSNWARVIEKNQPELAARLFEIVSTGENEAAIVKFDGRPAHLVGPWKTRYYWKVLTEVTTEFIDAGKDLRLSEKQRNAIEDNSSSLILDTIISQHETGLLFVDGKVVEELKPGRHAFWQLHKQITVARFDLRPHPVEITAQEILTKDRISLRVTLTAYIQVKQARRAYEETEDYQKYIYLLIQFAIREAIANRTLDEILNDRQKIDDQLRTYLEEHMGDIGVVVTDLGIKDIILPGEMRELINKVVAAEKTAQANLIRRREETAATRSLLNTAKLMENNPLLLRLKELESLEKLTEKVGRIDLHTGEKGGLDALVNKLLTLDNDQKGDGDQKDARS